MFILAVQRSLPNVLPMEAMRDRSTVLILQRFIQKIYSGLSSSNQITLLLVQKFPRSLDVTWGRRSEAQVFGKYGKHLLVHFRRGTFGRRLHRIVSSTTGGGAVINSPNKAIMLCRSGWATGNRRQIRSHPSAVRQLSEAGCNKTSEQEATSRVCVQGCRVSINTLITVIEK